MPNDESQSRDDKNLESRQTEQVAHAYRQDRRLDEVRPGHQQEQAKEPEARRPSMMNSLLATAVVALIAGVIGAMGYTHFFGARAGEPFLSQTKTEAGSHANSSTSGKSRGEPGGGSANETNTPGSASSAIQGAAATQEADDLNDRIRSLNQKIDRLGERVDRLQQLLSLAVPLLQRIAPKHD